MELVDFVQEVVEVADCSCPDKEKVIQKSPQYFIIDDLSGSLAHSRTCSSRMAMTRSATLGAHVVPMAKPMI